LVKPHPVHLEQDEVEVRQVLSGTPEDVLALLCLT